MIDKDLGQGKCYSYSKKDHYANKYFNKELKNW